MTVVLRLYAYYVTVERSTLIIICRRDQGGLRHIELAPVPGLQLAVVHVYFGPQLQKGRVWGWGIPSPFWKRLGPRIFCLIFGSRNAYFGEFYDLFNLNSIRKNMWKIIPLPWAKSNTQRFRFWKSNFLQFENQNVEFLKNLDFEKRNRF